MNFWVIFRIIQNIFVSAALIIGVAAVFIITSQLWQRRNAKTIIRGTGENLVIMIHGVGGNPMEFFHLMELFEKDRFTVFAPYSPENRRWGVLNTAYDIYLDLKTMLDSTKYKTMSFIGNSMGGLIARQLACTVDDRFDIYPTPYLFITTVTPHISLDRDRGLWAYFKRGIAELIFGRLTFNDLYTENGFFKVPESLASQVMSKYAARLNYVLSTWDSHVPYFSASMNETLEMPSSKGEFGMTRTRNGWIHFTVPIYSLFNHGNVVGKHMTNPLITPTWLRVYVHNSINHIRKQFDEYSTTTAADKK